MLVWFYEKCNTIQWWEFVINSSNNNACVCEKKCNTIRLGTKWRCVSVNVFSLLLEHDLVMLMIYTAEI